ncbi:branched-chain amino acid ABC transporter permease [Streptomyces sp. NPDC058464]|uniref:branched-chain amino acid ABC transporter permease n=1 Tax=Streptomyces sp. NPDC058464 TaxID=3346511 RepID=UPI00364F4820
MVSGSFLSGLGLPASAVAGLPGGAAYALMGVGLVLLYQMGGVLSLCQSAIGVFGAVLFQGWYDSGRSMWLALPAGLLLSAALAAAVGWLMTRWFADKSLLIRSAVTIACAVSFSALALRLYGTDSLVFPFLLPAARFEVASVIVSANTVLALALAAVTGAGMWALLRFSRLGVWLKAMAERAPAAELLGAPVRILNVGLWAFSGALAALALIVIAPTQQSDVSSLGTVALPALAAALIGGFRSFGVTIAVGIAIGVLESVIMASSLAAYNSLVSVALVLGVLLWSRRGDVWNEAR